MDPKWKEAERGLRIRELELFCKRSMSVASVVKDFFLQENDYDSVGALECT